MKPFHRLMQLSKSPVGYSKILEAYYSRSPSFLSGILNGTRWRHKSMGETLNRIIEPDILKQLHACADENLSLWASEKTQTPRKVEVLREDWGMAAFEATQKYGILYSVLNMANSLFPGGGALEGGSAQEENIWHRSSCPLSLLAKGIVYDEEKKEFRYDDEIRKLLRAQKKMSSEELELLSQLRGEKITEAYKIFFNDQQEVCFRGPEILFPTDFLDMGVGNRRYTADSGMSFSFLPKENIFPFEEFRAAAPELVTRSNVNWNDDEFLTDYMTEVRRRIGAQLDTLIIHQKPHAILGAWGCGSFKNKPQIIAKIYREEIEKRASYFEHIVFPIIDNDRTCNFETFREVLDDLKLGIPKNNSDLKRPPSDKLPNPHSFYDPGRQSSKEKDEDNPKKGPDNSFCTLL